MNLQDRILTMAKLGDYIVQNTDEYQLVKENAERENPWFIREFIELATGNIATEYLEASKLQDWSKSYTMPEIQAHPKKVGIVMAGNIPLVGFHDLLCVFASGHKAVIKTSSKDEILIKHFVEKLIEWNGEVAAYISFAANLKGCDAYIATGSNNSGRYFEYYFGKYPHIIRYNRTSVAILDGTETAEELNALADDILQYFGLGCRNVTKLYVPAQYDFISLLTALKKYQHLLDHHKYNHNYDYQLAVQMMSNKPYMTNGSVILTEQESPFTPVSQLNYEYYENRAPVEEKLKGNTQIQAVVGHGHIPFGKAQQPSLKNYADGVDTIEFLLNL